MDNIKRLKELAEIKRDAAINRAVKDFYSRGTLPDGTTGGLLDLVGDLPIRYDARGLITDYPWLK